MYNIKTPNGFYNGTTYGVKFINGIGKTDNEQVKNILINDFKYILLNEETSTELLVVDSFHRGSGYYEFPNGEKIRGKEKALEYLSFHMSEEGELEWV
ncbi:hypothetical protein LCM23_14665 [Cytobacillus kochii]|uniref:hypothetical protein n=1 Tax=Cytobacillus kochii TaxID=859143 RepID=UPI001CD55AC3|nr:hypothetical protein [Cytobacillus kochii]MCA1027340.1 hypothetical protein [Cytobacillus kochii]